MSREATIRVQELTKYFFNKTREENFKNNELFSTGVAILSIIISSLRVTEDEEKELMKMAAISIKEYLEAVRENRTKLKK